MAWFQKTITLAPRSRGFHLITEELVRALPDLARVRVGVAHFFIQHTSASLCINENADPTVRADLESHFDILAPRTSRTTATPPRDPMTCRRTSRRR
jgi:secondary thiamine-phosphate synthase enzyme